MSSMCGGVISQSQSIKMMKNHGIWAGVMAYVMPDDKFKEYIRLKKEGKKKEASKLFDRYARSQI